MGSESEPQNRRGSPGAAGNHIGEIRRQTMRPSRALTLSIVLSVIPTIAQSTAPYPFRDPNLRAEKRIDNILALVTVARSSGSCDFIEDGLGSRSRVGSLSDRAT